MATCGAVDLISVKIRAKAGPASQAGHPDRDPGQRDCCSLGQCVTAQVIEITLDPFLGQVAQFADLQADANHPRSLILGGVF